MFDPAKYPQAVTIGGLIEKGMELEIHCYKCAHYVTRDPGGLGFGLATPVAFLAERFRCSRCGSTETEARPHYTR